MSDCVLIGGVFDPLHAGHLAYIRTAQEYAIEHMCSVACALSDAPEKHPPLVPIHERAALLRGLGVNYLVGDVLNAIHDLKPKAYIKGKDWEGKLPPEQVAACFQHGVNILYTDTMTQSSSALLENYERTRNTEKLAAFESWVSQQKPADKPWEPVTDYSRETRRKIEAPHADAIVEAFDLLGCRPRTVLDYGCGFGYLVELLRERGVDVVGWDPTMPKYPTNPHTRDITICREVIEHVAVRLIPWLVHDLVLSARRFIYVTTRFTAKAHLLDFDGRDDLDPTHITLLNQDLLRTLFVLEGCTRRMDLEEKLDHRKLGRVLVYEVPA